MTNYSTKDGLMDDCECENKWGINDVDEVKYLTKERDMAINALRVIAGENGMCWANDKQEAENKTRLAQRTLHRIYLTIKDYNELIKENENDETID